MGSEQRRRDGRRYWKGEKSANSPGDGATEPGRLPYDLSARELTVLRLLAAGKADKEISRELSLSTFTINKHVRAILVKMDASSRTAAAVRAIREGLLDAPYLLVLPVVGYGPA
jgi:DNA-binding NarL/FixJ family response regulator